jgi:DNA-directed RNA polymerase specialized sigma24 family protein
MTVTLSEGGRIARQVAAKLHSRNPSVPKCDLEQEAWVGMLCACNFDEAIGSSKSAYLFRAAYIRALDHACAFKITLSGGSYRNREKLTKMRREEPEKISTIPTATTPESIMLKETRKKEVAAAANKACGQGTISTSVMLLLIAGEYRAREVADMLGLDIEIVYTQTRKAKHSLSLSNKLQQLHGE